MTITHRVQDSFFDCYSDLDDVRLIRLAPNAPPSKGPTKRQGRPWTNEEHDRFLHAMEIYSSGPWKDIAAHVATRTTRQTMTHAQKYRQKIARWKRGASTSSLQTPFLPSVVKSTTAAPPSPQAVHAVDSVVDDAEEDAVFWQIVQDLLEVNDGSNIEGSLVSLQDEYQYV